ncbi:MAG: hypothetical protein KGZ25_12805 [Planctomycetes bacterium]|nr:hypothetical protein [Planctomycetota bacterium]
MEKYITMLVIVMSFVHPCLAQQEKEYETLKELKQNLRMGFLKTLRTEDLPDLKPIVPQLKRLVKGEDSPADIETIGKHCRRLMKDKSEKAADIAIGVYFFTGDLKLLRMWTRQTEKIPPHLISTYLMRPNGTVRESLLKGLDGRKLENYIIEALIFKIQRRSRLFYTMPSVQSGLSPGAMRLFLTSVGDFRAEQLLAKLPQSARRDRLLLNLPFEVAGNVWIAHAYPQMVKKAYEEMNSDSYKPPINIFESYYRKVIQEAGLEGDFMKQLELRNMTDVIPDNLKPKDTGKQN